ncbi:hypothetical protein GS426_02080 [Rhodococcus hoagii]|nr:hypothetical protein [Prescottella equi]
MGVLDRVGWGLAGLQGTRPIRRLDETVDGVSHRQRLTDAVRTLPSLVKGGNRTVRHDARRLPEGQEGYRSGRDQQRYPAPDGANEDPSTISLDELLATLKGSRTRHARSSSSPSASPRMLMRLCCRRSRRHGRNQSRRAHACRDSRRVRGRDA